MTSHTSVCYCPKVITHCLPQSSVVDLQTTRCVGAVGETILHKSQVTKKMSCEKQCYVVCV